jgi:hypothetical protein
VRIVDCGADCGWPIGRFASGVGTRRLGCAATGDQSSIGSAIDNGILNHEWNHQSTIEFVNQQSADTLCNPQFAIRNGEA